MYRISGAALVGRIGGLVVGRIGGFVSGRIGGAALVGRTGDGRIGVWNSKRAPNPQVSLFIELLNR